MKLTHKDPSTHLLQLFDAPRSLADAVSHFLIGGRAECNHLLVIARASHWQLIRAYLERRSVPVDDMNERLTVIDARKLRAKMLRRGILDPARMHETLGELVAQLAAEPGGLCIYSEIAELSAEEANADQAEALEDYWNHLQKTCGFTLLCGYSSAHFANSTYSIDLQRICSSHTGIRSQPSDTLGTWLTSTH